ncbi:MAG: 3-dehydroquinate synthase [Candidatus Melainabacteria bacterium GWF2_37_15]|nr:MAG: 3-dehydroquinate synthase [Candidatus Melainabacteria bacterium GWF2_37_15]
MQTVTVKIPATTAYSYPIFIGSNILKDTGSYIKQYTKAKNLLLVSNKTVHALYGEKVMQSPTNEGFNAHFLLIEEGEEHKNIKSLELIWTRAIELKLERKDALIALGGGVIGDITGFAAATYLRGIDFIQIPTTLLAQVDSSIGGKVAINHALGKNLIGNFYQPKAVITDISTLNTLSETELKVGLAEVLKYGFIEKTCGLSENLGVPFIDYLDKNRSVSPELIKYCCELKAAVVNKDEKEAGLRAILNFGHTIGHAIEKSYCYSGINHGQAVAIGMRGAFIIAKNKELIKEDYYQKCMNLLDSYKMDYKISIFIPQDYLCDAMQVDKKVVSGKLRFVLPIGEAKVGIFDDITKEELIDALNCLY